MIIIPAGTTIIGELRSKGRIRVDGRVEGVGDIDGLLLITKDCVWKGKITADIIVIEGTVEGEIIARQRLKVHTNSHVSGNITSPQIQIEEGALISGRLYMRKPDAPIGLLENRSKKKPNEAIGQNTDYQEPVKKAAGE